MDLLSELPAGIAVAASLAAAVAGLIGALFWQGRRLARERDEVRRLGLELDRRRGVLSTMPDGTYVWDCQTGEERCSSRFVEMLGQRGLIPQRFSEVLDRFDSESARRLVAAIERLRERGTSFRLTVRMAADRRAFDVAGTRAHTTDGRAFADVLWLRDLAQAPEAVDGGELLRRVLGALPIAAWLRDADFQVRAANGPATGIADTDAAREVGRRAASQGVAQSERIAIDTPEGTRRFRLIETPLPARPGTVGLAIAEDDVAAATPPPSAPPTADLDPLVRHLAVAVALFGRDGRLELFNQPYADLWRLDSQWLAGGPSLGEILDRLREQRRLPEVADFRAFKADYLRRLTGLSEREERLLHLPDGTSVRTTAIPLPRGGFLALDENVSDRLDLERQLRSSSAVQKETLDHLYEAIAVFGSDGRLKLVNPAFTRLWGLGENALLDRHLGDILERMRPLLAVGDDWPAHKQRLAGRLLSRRPGDGRLVRADGSIVDYANVPLPDGAMLISYNDVTDGVRVERALRERAEALQEANRLKSEFIADVSFELRTPLTAIAGFAEVLSAEYFGKLNPRQLDYSRGILDGARSLAAVVNDIVDLASIDAGGLRLEIGPVDTHAALAAVLALVRERARAKQLTMEFDCPPDIGWLKADERRFKQVAFTVLSRAIAVSPPRSPVQLVVRRDGQDLNVAIGDRGPAIPLAEIAHVFHPFRRHGGDEAVAPSGIGLALVKRFVDLHGGRVAVASSAGKGTTVTCAWPETPLGG